MSITVVVGGQFGGEGKGKITAHLCREQGFSAAVRCGGPNSGHTVTIGGRPVVLRQVPAGAVNASTRLLLASGCLIDTKVLLNEIDQFSLTPDRLGIAHNAAIVEGEYAHEEEIAGLNKSIGSTCTGTGIAVAKRSLRSRDLKLAKDVSALKPYLVHVSKEVLAFHERGEKVVIEGTQGFGLSVYHSPYYPFATSRDTTASAFLSEVGVSPLAVSEIIMVIRTFPIRVGGNSGPLPNEIDWETLQRESGYPHKIQEYTTVTKRLRRVARFDLELVRHAAAVNMPTHIALMGVDYLDYENRGAKHGSELTEKTKDFIWWLQHELRVEISFIGSGPSDYELINTLEEQEYEQTGTREKRTIEIPLS